MAGKRVLVVDDDPDIRAYLTSLLEDNGYEAFAAADASRALDILCDASADAILVDVLMPGRSGLDLLVTLRRDTRFRGIPLVVVTGMDQILEDDCQSYLAEQVGVRGPDAVLGKPIDPLALLSVLRLVCDGRRAPVPVGSVTAS